MNLNLSTIEVVHLAWVGYDIDPDRYQAFCPCGWTSDWTTSQEAAEQAAAAHPDEEVPPADGLDAVMGELLNLQDDLAAMVVWLAENWSADLPVPVVFGCDGEDNPASIELHVGGSTEDVARIAHLLGVPTTDDVAPDRYGQRYRNAVRSFGRVTLRAFTSVINQPEQAP